MSPVLAVAALAALPPLVLLLIIGPLPTPDSGGYLAYAAQIATGLPSGAALVREAAAPISLFRAPLYPWLLHALGGPAGVVALQVALHAGLAAGLLVLARRFGLGPRLSVLAALLPSVGFNLHQVVAILPDAVAAALVAGGAILLALAALGRGSLAACIVAGIALALSTLAREATPYLALFLVPLAALAAGRGVIRRVAGVALVLLPPWLALTGLTVWNDARIGTPVATTSRQVVMVQALLPVLKRGIVLHSGDDAYDRAARAILRGDDYGSIWRLNETLFTEAGMTAPELAAAASERYTRAWRTHPGAMLRATLSRFRPEHLATGFDPGRTLGFVQVHAGGEDLFRIDRLWRRAVRGEVGAGLLAVLVLLGRGIGLVLGVLALAAPLLAWRRGLAATPVVAALWLLPAGLFAIYLPVHLEPRYLAPALPFVPLLAALALRPR